MNYSYVMGVKNIDKLKESGFEVKYYDDEYGISFTDDKIKLFEEFICNSLENGFWNEYLGKEIVFIFKFNDGKIKKYIVNEENKYEVFELCCKFADSQFESFDKMLIDNEFYANTYFKN